MRTLAALLVLALATPAAADRAANFSSSLVGADADTAGVITRHDAHGWSMEVRVKPGADAITIAAPTIPATHGDYIVFVAPGRGQIAWVLSGDVEGLPAADKPVVWQFDVATGAVVETTFNALYTKADRKASVKSTAGEFLFVAAPVVDDATMTLKLKRGAVVVDLAAGTVKRTKK